MGWRYWAVPLTFVGTFIGVFLVGVLTRESDVETLDPWMCE